MRPAPSPTNARIPRVAEAVLARCARRKAAPDVIATLFLRRLAAMGIPVHAALLCALEERVVRTHDHVLPEGRAAHANALVRATFAQIRLLMNAEA